MARLFNVNSGGQAPLLGGEAIRSIQLAELLRQPRRNPQSGGETLARLGADLTNQMTLLNLARKRDQEARGEKLRGDVLQDNDNRILSELLQGNTGLNADKAIAPTPGQFPTQQPTIPQPTQGVGPSVPSNEDILPQQSVFQLPPGGNNTGNLSIPLSKSVPQTIPPTDQSLIAPVGPAPAQPTGFNQQSLSEALNNPGTAQFARQFLLSQQAEGRASAAQDKRFQALSDQLRQKQGFRAEENRKSREKVLTPAQFQQQKQLNALKGVKVNQTVTSGGKEQSEEDKIIGKGRGQAFVASGEAALNAEDQNFELEALSKINLDTGPGTNFKATLAEVGQAFGFTDEKISKFTGNAQKFRGIIALQVNKELNKAKGPQTEGDAQRAKNTLANLGNSPEANRFIINLTRAKNNRVIQRHAFFDKFKEDSNTLKGVNKAWRESPENAKSLFEDPVLSEFSENNSPQLNPVEVQDFLKKKGFK